MNLAMANLPGFWYPFWALWIHVASKVENFMILSEFYRKSSFFRTFGILTSVLSLTSSQGLWNCCPWRSWEICRRRANMTREEAMSNSKPRQVGRLTLLLWCARWKESVGVKNIAVDDSCLHRKGSSRAFSAIAELKKSPGQTSGLASWYDCWRVERDVREVVEW